MANDSYAGTLIDEIKTLKEKIEKMKLTKFYACNDKGLDLSYLDEECEE